MSGDGNTGRGKGKAWEATASQSLVVTEPLLLMVTAPGLLDAAERIGDLPGRVVLRNGVRATGAQIRKAGTILRDGPQPVCNGVRSDMPGFIDRAAQTGNSLVLQVGILPTRVYRIDCLGRARQA